MRGLRLISSNKGILFSKFYSNRVDLNIKKQEMIISMNRHQLSLPKDLMVLIIDGSTPSDIVFKVIRKNKMMIINIKNRIGIN